jgi:hypothetical protein
MPVAMATTATAATIPTATTRRSITGAGVGGGENGKFFGQLGRTTMRAGCAFPMAGTDENFAVALAFFALKFVNWHGRKIINVTKSSRRDLDFVFSFNGQRLTFAHDSLATGD